ncbi:DUF418 domain-containing protein [Streptomyces sp. NPDC050625]|uniref:DUF418 domain-containing protein n=1 Tax=Streptomyces sp. NPDC050625 TaxID=3154629 RepID=UPI00343C6B95
MEGTAARIAEIDALRGFALLGICLVNAQVIAGVDVLPTGPVAVGDHFAAWLVTALCTMKFYLLYSFLFGYSFTLQMRAADRDGVPFARRHGRRLLGLFLIGAAHAVLLYPGDILTTYAVLGLVLMAVRRLRARTALRIAGLIIAFLTAVFLVIGVLTLVLTGPGSGAATDVAASDAAAYRGGLLDIIRANVGAYRQMVGGAILYSGHLFAAFLVGFAAGKHRVLEEPARYTLWAKPILGLGALIGLPGSMFMAMCENGPLDARFAYVGRAFGILTAPVLTAAYVCGLLLLMGRSRFGRRLREALAPAGRMALTNYLLQSLVLAFVFTGYGFALYGRVGPGVLALGCLGLYVTQLLAARHAMAHARYGPAELLLRRITGTSTVRC